MADLFKLNPFDEFQLWLDGLLAHHRHSGIPFGTKTAVLLNRDFREDIRTSLQVVEDLIGMAQRMVAAELLQIREVDPSALAQPGKDLRKQFRQYKNYARGIDDFVSFWDFLENYRTLGVSLVRLPNVTRVEFKAFTYVLTDQIARFRKSESSVYLKRKFYDWQFSRLIERDITRLLDAEGTREVVERVFLEFFQLLCTVHYMRDEMRRRFPFRKLMMLFMHLHFAGRRFLKVLDDSRRYLGEHFPQLSETMYDTGLALKMDMRRVFSGELRDLESIRKLDVVYAQMQNGLGMLLNGFQESFITLAHQLNPSFNEFELFEELGRKHRESMALLNGLKAVYQAIASEPEKVFAPPKFAEVKQTLAHFRETAMKYLFFKDWSAFEQFSEELDKAAPEERVFVLHRLQVYVSTLIGEVQKRTVLSKFGPDRQVTPKRFGF